MGFFVPRLSRGRLAAICRKKLPQAAVAYLIFSYFYIQLPGEQAVPGFFVMYGAAPAADSRLKRSDLRRRAADYFFECPIKSRIIVIAAPITHFMRFYAAFQQLFGM